MSHTLKSKSEGGGEGGIRELDVAFFRQACWFQYLQQRQRDPKLQSRRKKQGTIAQGGTNPNWQERGQQGRRWPCWDKARFFYAAWKIRIPEAQVVCLDHLWTCESSSSRFRKNSSSAKRMCWATLILLVPFFRPVVENGTPSLDFST